MNILNIQDKNSLKNAAEVLASGGIFVFPTDTVYGIGCAINKKAILKLYDIKKRPLTQSTAILMSNKDIPDILKGEYEKYPTGQITIIADISKYKINFPSILIKDNKIGVRVPNDIWLRKLLEISGPIVASSANLAGESTPEKFDDIDTTILDQADLAIKTDRITSNPPSTVYDVELEKTIRV